MYGFSGNFLAGLLLGALLAMLAPFAAIDLAAGFTAPNPAALEQAEPQSVNRTAKTDRLVVPVRDTPDERAPVRATRDTDRATRDTDNVKPAKIPVGCDPAFSPLSREARHNFSRRCVV
jgi:hypothetical protein